MFARRWSGNRLGVCGIPVHPPKAVWWLLLVFATTSLSAKDKWIQIRSPHFQAISNAGERRCRKTVEELEQFRQNFSQLFTVRDDGIPIRVMVFRNEKSFRPFQPLYKGKPRSLAGYFQKGVGLDIIALDGSDQDPLRVIYHEYVHLLAGRFPLPLPLWFGEGIAEFYSTFKVKGDKAVIGEPITEHIFLLREQGLLALENLFKVGHSSREYNETSKTGVFYAESWAVVHYLMLARNGERRPQLARYIAVAVSGAEPIEAFKASFDTPLNELEKELWSFIQQREVNITIVPLEKTESNRHLEAQPVSESDALAYQADLLLHTHRAKEAAVYYEKALQLQPDNQKAFEGLGLLSLRDGDHKKALEYFSKVDISRSTNHLASYHYGQALMESEGIFTKGRVSLSDEEYERLRRPLQRAVDLLPTFAEGYYLLAVLHRASDRDREKGITLIRQAIELKPQELSYRELLANLQVDNQDWAGARETVNSLDAFQTLQAQQFAQDMRRYIDYLEKSSQDEIRGGEETARADSDGDGNLVTTNGDAAVEAPPTSRRPDRTPEVTATKPGCRPDFVSVVGAQVVAGRITGIQCEGSSVFYVGEIGGRTVRLVGRDPDIPVVFSCDLDLSRLGCGPLTHPANFYLPSKLEPDPVTGCNYVLAIEVKPGP